MFVVVWFDALFYGGCLLVFVVGVVKAFSIRNEEGLDTLYVVYPEEEEVSEYDGEKHLVSAKELPIRSDER